MDGFSSMRAKWDFLKFQVKQKAMNISKQKAKELREEVKKLENAVERYQAELVIAPSNDEIKTNLASARSALDIFHTQKTKALIMDKFHSHTK